MNSFDSIYRRSVDVSRDEVTANAFLWSVYRWMSLGLGITGLTAVAVANSEAAVNFIFTNRWAFWGIVIVQFCAVLVFQPLALRASAALTAALFAGYSALTGLTLSVIFLMYTMASIGTIFFVTAGTFGLLSFYGVVTRRDLATAHRSPPWPECRSAARTPWPGSRTR